MKQSEVFQWLFGELREILASTPNTGISSTTEANNHVDIAEGDVDHPYPFIGVQEIATNTQTAGIGSGSLYVDDVVYSGGVLSEIKYRRESTLRLNILPIVDNDPKLRDDLSTAIIDHFALKIRTGEYPSDIDNPEISEKSPQNRSEEFVRGSAIPLTLEYKRFLSNSDPSVASEVDLDVDVSGSTPDDLETAIDAYQETFN